MSTRRPVPRPHFLGRDTPPANPPAIPPEPPKPPDAPPAPELLDPSQRLLTRKERPGRLDETPTGLDPRPGMGRMRFGAFAILGFAMLAIPGPVFAQDRDSPGTIAQQVGIVQNLGAQLPLDAKLRDEDGRTVRLGEFLGRKPAVLTFVYYRCPMLCSKELESLTRSLRVMSMKIGDEFDIITVSISPDETPELAKAKKKAYMKALDRPGGAKGWHFLTADKTTIATLTETAGFRFRLDTKTGLYAHDAGLIVVTPEGKIAKYLPGLDYPAKNLQGVLKESSRGVIGRAATWVKLLCYDYDPSTGKYSLAILRTVRAGGIFTVVALAASVLWMNYRARKQDRIRALAAPSLG